MILHKTGSHCQSCFLNLLSIPEFCQIPINHMNSDFLTLKIIDLLLKTHCFDLETHFCKIHSANLTETVLLRFLTILHVSESSFGFWQRIFGLNLVNFDFNWFLMNLFYFSKEGVNIHSDQLLELGWMKIVKHMIVGCYVETDWESSNFSSATGRKSHVAKEPFPFDLAQHWEKCFPFLKISFSWIHRVYFIDLNLRRNKAD